MSHAQIKETVLGPLVTRTGFRSSINSLKTFPEYKVEYPRVVVDALADLYREYNRSFAPLIDANREWTTDYRFCKAAPGILNYFGQVDMLGLLQEHADPIEGGTVEAAREFLRYRIFEIENSLATYQLFERAFPNGSDDSFFSIRYRAALDRLRQRFDRPIALLAVTEEKYEAIRAVEFGKSAEERLSSAEVETLSGFQALLGPRDFRLDLAREYLLYVRCSDPIAKLKKPNYFVRQLLLGDERARQLVKERALTLNIDSPEMQYQKRINDTKEYLVAMGMGHLVSCREDFESPVFERYFLSQGMSLDDVTHHRIQLRAKPMKGAYGCYGHVRGFANSEFFRRIRHEIASRGPYIIQPEMSYPMVRDRTGQVYTVMDRVFFGMAEGSPTFLGGFRFLMPANSLEARRGRNHGHDDVIWAEIVS